MCAVDRKPSMKEERISDAGSANESNSASSPPATATNAAVRASPVDCRWGSRMR